MKNEALTDQDWDDLVFENRNKEYGAFALRRSYSASVLEGTMISIGLAVFLFCLPVIVSWFASEITRPIVIHTDGGLIDPPVLPTQPRLKMAGGAASKRIKGAGEPVVSRDSVSDEKVIPADSMPSSNGNSEVDDHHDDDGSSAGVSSGNAASGSVDVIPQPAYVDFAAIMPQFEGGMQAMAKFIQKKLKYPTSARRIGMEGTVFVRFVVSTDGKVTDVEVVRGIHNDCDKEAARVIALMDSWKPGFQNHSPVAVRMVLPINFKLSN